MICKQPLGPDAEPRLRHEVTMLERLRGVEGVAQLLEVPGPSGSITLADAGETSLAGVAKPLGVDELVRLAETLARAVAGMHRHGVMHRDITPANIALSRDATACLVDFALATSVAELRPGFTHHTQILGTLAYLAPESTGRTGRPVDQRADLYALGATLYEAATGRPPFGTGDPLALIHDHLARIPVAPAEINPAIPASLSQIIVHLLEKEPDYRYQTADGLLFDLQRLRGADAPAEGFRVGGHDLPLRLLPPSRLVGRDKEIAALETAFHEARVGWCRVVLVAGAAGVGKTALVDQLRPVVTGSDGWFVAGKFDQYRRDLEFDAVHQTGRALTRLLLAEPEAQRAREGLLAGGDLANAAYSYHPAVFYLLDCAPELDGYNAEVEAGLTFVRRTGNEQAGQWLDCYRWLAGVLRGEGPAEEAIPADLDGNPPALYTALFTRAVAAAILGDPDALARHTAAAMPLLPVVVGHCLTALTRLLRGLALAEQARTAGEHRRGEVVAELDQQIAWLAARVVDAPENFSHLVRWLEAERAWSVGDFRGAALAFDAARHEVAARRCLWHRALIAERAARFQLAHGLEHTGSALLAEARQGYTAWGATAKVAQLDWAYPTLRPAAETTAGRGSDAVATPSHRRATVTTGTIDLLGILSASQALSSETSLDRLQARVVEILGALTGATDVHLLLWEDDRQDWLLPAPAGTVPVGTGHETAVPLSVLRYVRRTGEPLVVADATADDRFARDPYLAGADCCALLAVPILSRSSLRAMLLLENRLLRGAFTADRLDAVTLIAGQLAVSLDNAQLYQQLTTSRARIVAAADQARLAHRARPARRRPATAGQPRPAAARRAGRGATGGGPARRAAGGVGRRRE